MLDNNNIIIVIGVVILGCYIMSKRNQKENFANKPSERQCKIWAARRECKRNPGYMNIHCKKACQNMKLNKECARLNSKAYIWKDPKLCLGSIVIDGKKIGSMDDVCNKKFNINKQSCARAVLSSKFFNGKHFKCNSYHKCYLKRNRDDKHKCLKNCDKEAGIKAKFWGGKYDHCVDRHKKNDKCRDGKIDCYLSCDKEATSKTNQRYGDF